MSEGPQREMALDEWMAALPKTHRASVELASIRDRIAALERELAEARKNNVREMCITEAASFSPSIADYVKHWEDRAEKAEAALAAARAELAQARAEQGSSPMVALVAERDAARAEVERVARRFFFEGVDSGDDDSGAPDTFDAAWSRYQQERKP